MPGSLPLDSCEFDHLGPLFSLGGHIGAEVSGGEKNNGIVATSEPGLYGRVCQSGIDQVLAKLLRQSGAVELAMVTRCCVET
jgi:hypothetical protein